MIHNLGRAFTYNELNRHNHQQWLLHSSERWALVFSPDALSILALCKQIIADLMRAVADISSLSAISFFLKYEGLNGGGGQWRGDYPIWRDSLTDKPNIQKYT